LALNPTSPHSNGYLLISEERMSRRDALNLYKTLHRTVQRTFKGDIPALLAARDKICEEYNKHSQVTSGPAIAELINHGQEVNRILAETVVQIAKVEEDKYELRITEETHMFENNPFRDDISMEEYKAANRRARMRGKCDEAKANK